MLGVKSKVVPDLVKSIQNDLGRFHHLLSVCLAASRVYLHVSNHKIVTQRLPWQQQQPIILHEQHVLVEHYPFTIPLNHGRRSGGGQGDTISNVPLTNWSKFLSFIW